MNTHSSSPIPMCPMAKMCGGLMGEHRFGFAPHFMGAILILLGITILIEPRIAVWALALLLILVGVMVIVVASLLRKIGEEIADLS